MYNNKKNIKITLILTSLLLVATTLFVQHNTYGYIDDRMFEHEEQFFLYQEEQAGLYEKNIALYKDELLDISNELSDVKKELDDVKQELENVKKDISTLQQSYKNIKNSGSPSTNGDKLYAGRLYVPSVGISVALYNGFDQYITDRVDSANLFYIMNSENKIIADHNYQEFSKLFNVKIGTTGYIKFKDGSTRHIKCVEIFSGYNIRYDITDKNGNSVTDKEDYLMYTCQNGSRNVLICLWTVI